MRTRGTSTEEQGLQYVCNRCDGSGRVPEGETVRFEVRLVNFLGEGYLPPVTMVARAGDPCPICMGRGKLGAVDEVSAPKRG